MANYDFRGDISFKFKLSKLFLFRKLSIFINKLFLTLKNIPIGEKSTFYGITNFSRKPYSKMVIGDNCDFRSIQVSNSIGINRRCTISTLTNNAKIVIGNNCGFSGTVIGSFDNIYIGNNVKCGANSVITDSNWHLNDPRSGPPKEVIIEDNVWLGLNTVVLKGVTIGKNSIIGANSVVTKSIPRNSVAAGNPCNIIRELRSEEYSDYK